MKTKEEVLNKITLEESKIEQLEHLIAESELSIKMHKKDLDKRKVCINCLKWFIE